MTKSSKAPVRERIAQEVENLLDGPIKEFLTQAMGAERKLWLTCEHCKRRGEVEVPDWRARTAALELALNQGFGRPSQEVGGGGGDFILKRTIVSGDATKILHIAERLRAEGQSALAVELEQALEYNQEPPRVTPRGGA